MTEPRNDTLPAEKQIPRGKEMFAPNKSRPPAGSPFDMGSEIGFAVETQKYETDS